MAISAILAMNPSIRDADERRVIASYTALSMFCGLILLISHSMAS
jgi:hypothetical protein